MLLLCEVRCYCVIPLQGRWGSRHLISLDFVGRESQNNLPLASGEVIIDCQMGWWALISPHRMMLEEI